MKLRDVEQQIAIKIQPIMDLLDDFCGMEISDPPAVTPPYKPGWFWWSTEDEQWLPGDIHQAGTGIALDFEAEQDEQGVYRPTCCAAYDTDGVWWHSYPMGAQVVELPDGRLVIGQNVVSYDRRYLSCAYQGQDCYYLDTMQLAMMIGGLIAEDPYGETDLSMHRLWKTFEKQKSAGNGVPSWFDYAHPCSLAALSERYLNTRMDKSVRDRLQDDPTSVEPSTLWQYCASDVLQTAKLAQVLINIVRRQFISSPVTWFGMMEESRYRIYMDLDGEIQRLQQEILNSKARLKTLQDRLIQKAIATEEKTVYSGIPVDSWKLYSRGVNKGKPKWIANVNDDDPLSTNLAVSLLLLRWGNDPVELRRTPPGQPAWYCQDEPLPHPTGDGNLGSPLCPEYAGYARSGHLSSQCLNQDRLVELFELRSEIKAQEKRLKGLSQLYSQPVGDTQVIASGHNPCSNVFRQGDGVLSDGDFIPVSFAGYENVSLTFRAINSLTSLSNFCGDIAADRDRSLSLLYSLESLIGDMLVANRLINTFANFGGINAAINLLVEQTGKPRPQCESLAQQCFDLLLDSHGDIISLVEKLRTAKAQRSFLLSVRQPKSIDPEYIPTARSFTTIRSNWILQSGLVDQRHLLIALIQSKIDNHELDAYLSFSSGQLLNYYVKPEHRDLLTQAFDDASWLAAEIINEASAKFWGQA